MTGSLGRQVNIDAVIAGNARLSNGDALRLLKEASLHDLGRWSSAMAERIHGAETRTYIIDRNINYTNVCTAHCTFCAFRRDAGDADSYILSDAQLHDKIRELVDIGGTQILLQGGMHPDLPLSWYLDMLQGISAAFPSVHIHGFSPPEFVEFAAVLPIDGFPTPGIGRGDDLPRDLWIAKIRHIMAAMKEAGLDSLPGGGEIFAPHVRARIGIGKATGQQWLDTMTVAHELGMLTSATMMFGHLEGLADRVAHIDAVRRRQDAALQLDSGGRYVSFISWPYQRDNTPLDTLPDYGFGDEPFPGDVLAEMVMRDEVDGTDRKACSRAVPRAGKMLRMAGGTEYLRTQAVSRLMLDNVASIGSSWVTMGPRIGQVGLFFGANDMGSVMMEENVVSAAGTTYCLNEPYLCHLIRDAGFTPAQRDNAYNLLRTYPDGDPYAPDLNVDDWSTQRAQVLSREGVAGEADAREKPVDLTVSA